MKLEEGVRNRRAVAEIEGGAFGICFGCGKETAGAPVRPDPIILFARKFRGALSLPRKRTVACAECLPALVEKRKRFEKRLLWHKWGAALFFILALAMAAYTENIGLQAVLGAAVAAAFIIMLSAFSYCPDFEKNL